jgi:gamma-glutamylcyclotransferase (GGCT)/AIG2-like uncharacterized protein YtfP
MPPTETRSRLASLPSFGQKAQASEVRAALFVYGSLMFDDVLDAIIGRIPAAVSASTIGWRSVALPERTYPGMIPQPGHKTSGRVLADLSPAEWDVLDRFEDPVYSLKRVPTDTEYPAWAYVCPSGLLPGGAARDWDAQRFADEHLESYVKTCAEWRRGLSDNGR